MSTATASIPVVRAGRRTLSPMTAFVGTSIAFGSLYLAAGAPTPLFVLLEREWGFPPALLTIAFAAYAVGLLVSLLVAGSLSDHLGRRPVIIGALVIEIASMVMFVFAPNIGWVIGARVVQGLATGAATSAFSAAIVELAPPKHKKLGAVIGGTAATGGLALGALLSGVAVQFAAAPAVIVFTALAVVMAGGLAVAVYSSETVTRRAGALRALRPQVLVPVAARRTFVAAVPGMIGAWMLAALFLGLVPSVIHGVFHIDSGLLNGATAFIEPGAASVTGFVLGSVAAGRTRLIGSVGVLLGAIVIGLGIAFGVLPLLMVGGLLGGVGFGASFSGTLRSVGALAQPHERAGVFAAVFVVAYLSFGIPAIIVGQLVVPFGLLPTVLGFGVVIAIAALVGLVLQVRSPSEARASQL